MELDHEPVRVAGLSQGELSELVGLSRLSVNRYMQKVPPRGRVRGRVP